LLRGLLDRRNESTISLDDLDDSTSSPTAPPSEHEEVVNSMEQDTQCSPSPSRPEESIEPVMSQRMFWVYNVFALSDSIWLDSNNSDEGPETLYYIGIRTLTGQVLGLWAQGPTPPSSSPKTREVIDALISAGRTESNIIQSLLPTSSYRIATAEKAINILHVFTTGGTNVQELGTLDWNTRSHRRIYSMPTSSHRTEILERFHLSTEARIYVIYLYSLVCCYPVPPIVP
jgi:hypothetical protein